MSFLIINEVDQQTIDDLNITFNMSLSKNIRQVRPILTNPWIDDRKLNEVKRLMEQDDEVQYDRNTY